MTFPRRVMLLLLAALMLGLLAVGVSGCGYSSDSKDVAEGETVKIGDLKYIVVFSRYLNPHDAEDEPYLVGQEPPPEGDAYFGVFLQVQNKTEETQDLPSTVSITDADKQEYELLPSESLYAFPFGGELESQEQVPTLDGPAQQGPIEGAMALFLLTPEASDNRPLTLHIPAPNGEEAEVELDL